MKYKKRKTTTLPLSSARTRMQKAASATVERLEQRSLLAVTINEFLAKNTNGIVDEDFAHSDWIELKNTGATSVDIAGWYLTDDSALLTKWQFPSTVIPAGGYQLVWASGKDRRVSGQPLHTNFDLNAAGEYLALVQADGTTIATDFNPFPVQQSDISYGNSQSTTNTATDNLVDQHSPAKFKSPSTQSPSTDDFWKQVGFDDSSWISGQVGVGFDRNPSPTFTSLLDTNLTTTQMPSSRSSLYTRMPFTVNDKDQYTSMSFQLQYDDGFVVFLNDDEIMRVNMNDSGIPKWNTTASAARDAVSASTYQVWDFTPYLDHLVNGNNMLAIQGLNYMTAPENNDLLINPRLLATRAIAQAPGYMSAPTPGANNSVGTLGFVDDTHFSALRGFYTSPFQLEITSTTPGASIRYTTDNSAPSETHGTLYAGPITISTTTVVRAIAYKTGYTATNVDTETYVFLNDVIHQTGTGLQPTDAWGHAGPDWEMDPDIVNNPTYSGTIINDLKSVPSMSLVMDWNDLFGPNGQGIYIQGKSSERAAHLEYWTADNSDAWHEDVAAEISGNFSAIRWDTDKLSFQIKFKKPYGATKLNHPVFTDPQFDQIAATQFDGLTLDAMYGYTWNHTAIGNRQAAKYVQDQVMADLQNLAGAHAPHGKFVQLYLNGLYWGLYYLHERPDANFLSSYYGGSSNDYYVFKDYYTLPVDGGVSTINDFQNLLNLSALDLSNNTNYQNVANLLDIDDFVKYMAIQYQSGSQDWGHQNYYAFRNHVVPGGKWHYIVWDQESAYANVNDDTTNKVTVNGPINLHYALLANPEYKLKFTDAIQRMYFNGGILSPSVLANIYQTRVNQIDRAIVGQSARWGDNRDATPWTRANWRATADAMQTSFFPQRTNISYNQLVAKGWLVTTLGAVVFSQNGGTINPPFNLTLSLPAGAPGGASIYYTTDGSDPRLAGGAISPTAILYTGPISLSTAKRIQARVKNGTDWSPINDQTFFLATPFPVRIVEMNYHPAAHAGIADPENLEFIELQNTGSSVIDLQNVSINVGVTYTFAASTLLNPGQRIVVVKSLANFQQIYGTSINVAAGNYTGKLDNTGEQVVLKGPLGEILQDFIYDDQAPWPTTADGGGRTLQIIDPLANPNTAANWRASYAVDGTPGADDPPPDTTPPTVLSSIFDFETGHKISITFSEAMKVIDLNTTDLSVTSLATNSAVAVSSVSYDSGTNTATWTFAPPLPDGNYSAFVIAGSVSDLAGNAMLLSSTPLSFFVLAGDINRDRHVDSLDQTILTANLNQTPRTYSQADLNYDGTVNSADQTVLTSNLNLWLPAQGTLLAVPTTTGNDVARLLRESPTLVDIFYNGSSTATYRVSVPAVSGMSFTGDLGNDTLTLDFANGTPFAGTTFAYDGSGGTDSLQISGSIAADSATFSTASITMNGATVSIAGYEALTFSGKTGGDTLVVDSGVNLNTNVTQVFASLTVNASGAIKMAQNSNSVLDITTLNLSPTGKIDITNNAIVLRTTNALPAMTTAILSGQNGFDNTNGQANWDGFGIISSTARSQNVSAGADIYGIGAIRNADLDDLNGPGSRYTVWKGRSVSAETVLIRFTYLGDADLNGTVTIDDYNLIDGAALGLFPVIGWASGNFDYTGSITIDDYNAIDTAYLQNGPSLGV